MGVRPGTSTQIAWLGLVAVFAIAAAPSLDAQTTRRGGTARKAGTAVERSVDPFDEPSQTPDDGPESPRPGGLRMSRAVVCKSINGYEMYKPLPGAAQTSDEKLLIYFRPLRYKIDYDDGYYRAHLVQDNEIRRRGRKEIVRQKKKVVEYDPKSRDPLGPIFIRNTISLKGLEPGEYDLTIILRDELEKSAPPSRQVVKFKVIPPHDPRARPAPAKAQDPPTGP